MNYITAKHSLLSILTFLPTEEQSSQNELLSKITKVSSILNDIPELNKDVDIFRTILEFTKEKGEMFVKEFRRKQCVKFAITFENGRFVKIHDRGLIPENEMASIMRTIPMTTRFYECTKTLSIVDDVLRTCKEEEFWNYIKTNKVRFLNIQTPNGTIIYDQVLLVQFIDRKVPMLALPKLCTLVFEDEIELIEAQGTLYLCGKFLNAILSGRWGEDKAIDLRNVPITVFNEILNFVKLGVPNPAFDFKQEIVTGFLDFSLQYNPLPDKAYGKEKWNTTWGDVGSISPPHKSFFDAMQELCPFENKDKDPSGLKKIDTHEIFYMPPFVNNKPFTVNLLEELAKLPQFGLSIAFESITDKIRNKIGSIPIQEGYWFAAPKKALEEMRNKDCL